MNAVGLWVANLPGAYVRVPLFGVGPMLLAPTQPRSWRPPQPPLHSSAAASSIGRSAESPLLPPRLDVLIAGDGRGFAVRGNDGRFPIHHIGGDSFAVREWLAADADGRDVHNKSLEQGIVCDASGCIGKLADGAPVSYVLTPEAFEEDCARAALVVASRGEPTADCRQPSSDARCGAIAARSRCAAMALARAAISSSTQRDRRISIGRATRSVCRDFRRMRPGRDWHSRA